MFDRRRDQYDAKKKVVQKTFFPIMQEEDFIKEALKRFLPSSCVTHSKRTNFLLLLMTSPSKPLEVIIVLVFVQQFIRHGSSLSNQKLVLTI